MKIIGVIPARYKSSRFPGKPLVEILGLPMIIHVAKKVEQALGKENTYVATDDERIVSCVEKYGYKAVMTSENCLTGTDRLADFALKVEADIYVNVQGDEPMVNPLDIQNIASIKKENMDFVINGMASLSASEDPTDVNIPKVLVNQFNELIYMSRLAIPGTKEKEKKVSDYKKQVCIYAFTKEELQAFSMSNKKAVYESYEDIEILRFFDLGKRIKMVETSTFSLAVDNPEDVDKVEKALK